MGTSRSIALAELRAWLERAHGGCRLQQNRLPFGVSLLDVAFRAAVLRSAASTR